ncbi:MAG TPA: hypothetical protein VFZ00_04870 [Solirubrobacter sp.]|jgi:hypothetical protein|nr:hypothetical protein [Solirubrobacter sp.]
MSAVTVAVLACVGVLVFDAVASLLARYTPLRYTWFAPGSLAIYLAAGYFAGDAAGSVVAGAAAGAAAAAVEATIGWRVARWFGVDSADRVSESLEMGVATIVTVSGAVLGAVGAVLA